MPELNLESKDKFDTTFLQFFTYIGDLSFKTTLRRQNLCRPA